MAGTTRPADFLGCTLQHSTGDVALTLTLRSCVLLQQCPTAEPVHPLKILRPGTRHRRTSPVKGNTMVVCEHPHRQVFRGPLQFIDCLAVWLSSPGDYTFILPGLPHSDAYHQENRVGITWLLFVLVPSFSSTVFSIVLLLGSCSFSPFPTLGTALQQQIPALAVSPQCVFP